MKKIKSLLGVILLVATAVIQSFPSPKTAQAYFISSSVAASIRIDCKPVGEIEAKKSKQFFVDLHGEHLIEAYSPSNLLLSRETVGVEAGALKMYPIPVGRGIGAAVEINGSQYKTVYLFGKEWLAEGLREANAGYTANPPGFNERLYIWSHVAKFVPSGWRVPSESDFNSLISNLASPIIDLQPGGITGMNIEKAGQHVGGDLGDHRGRWEYARIWTSSVASAPPDHMKTFVLANALSFDVNPKNATHNFVSVRYVRDSTPKGPCD